MPSRSLLLGVVAGLAVACASCAGATLPAAPSRFPSQALLPYAGRAMALFDDDIEPQALGYAVSGGPRPEDEGRLRERTRLGDRVLRARIVTVTSSDTGDAPILRLGLHTLEGLAGSEASDPDFTLGVAASARGGGGVLKDSPTRLVGLTLIAFVRTFAGDADDAQVHFHLAKDDDSEANAVRVAGVEIGPR